MLKNIDDFQERIFEKINREHQQECLRLTSAYWNLRYRFEAPPAQPQIFVTCTGFAASICLAMNSRLQLNRPSDRATFQTVSWSRWQFDVANQFQTQQAPNYLVVIVDVGESWKNGSESEAKAPRDDFQRNFWDDLQYTSQKNT